MLHESFSRVHESLLHSPAAARPEAFAQAMARVPNKTAELNRANARRRRALHGRSSRRFRPHSWNEQVRPLAHEQRLVPTVLATPPQFPTGDILPRLATGSAGEVESASGEIGHC